MRENKNNNNIRRSLRIKNRLNNKRLEKTFDLLDLLKTHSKREKPRTSFKKIPKLKRDPFSIVWDLPLLQSIIVNPIPIPPPPKKRKTVSFTDPLIIPSSSSSSSIKRLPPSSSLFHLPTYFKSYIDNDIVLNSKGEMKKGHVIQWNLPYD